MKKLLHISFIVILFLFCNACKVQAAENNMPNEVDVVLFWGQSNMVGTSGRFVNERKKDTRNLSSFIDDDILKQYRQMNYVSVQIPSGAAYEYKINELGRGYLNEINSKTIFTGENLTYTYDYESGRMVLLSNNKYTSQYYDFISLSQSYGTNMIQQFCKTYYETTGRKIVAVMAGKGGEAIANFLPSNDPNYGDEQKKYLYESIIYKYENAIMHLNNRGIKVKNKFYVVCQGESDSNSELANSYYKNFLKVHQNLKKDLGLKFGVINTTGGKINAYNRDITNVRKINAAQKKLANDNNDIIIGSNLGYEVYNKKIKQAFCLEKSYYTGSNQVYDNSIHFNSATLSQMGKESAKAAATQLKSAISNKAPGFIMSVKDGRIYYKIQDETKINKYEIKQLSTQKSLFLRNISNENKREIYNSTDLFKLKKGEVQTYLARAEDALGNIVSNQFLLKRNEDGNYQIKNPPKLYNVYTEGNIVNFYFSDSKEIYVKNLNESNFRKKNITKINNNPGNDYCKISVPLSEMSYKNGIYYLYIRAYDTMTNKVHTTQRIMFRKK